MSMRQDGLQTTREILHLVLRGSSSTDERLALEENLSLEPRTESLFPNVLFRLLQLLNDSKTCLSVANDIAR